MRFHIPSFMTAFRRFLPYEVNYFRHKYTLFLLPVEGHLSTSVIQDVVSKSLIFSCEHLEGTQNPTEERTLFESLPETHTAALQAALAETDVYIRRYVKRQELLEAGVKNHYEYQVDLWKVQELLVNVRTRQDALLIQDHLPHLDTVSLRMLRGLLLRFTGYDFSHKRLSAALAVLEKQGHLQMSKRTRHTVGRKVIHKKTVKKWFAERRVNA